jgi:predicted RNA-binding Zn-ribbon protein involved in translation (DUF1610 family)
MKNKKITLRCPKCGNTEIIKVFNHYGWEYECKACKFTDEYDYFIDYKEKR